MANETKETTKLLWGLRGLPLYHNIKPSVISLNTKMSDNMAKILNGCSSKVALREFDIVTLVVDIIKFAPCGVYGH